MERSRAGWWSLGNILEALSTDATLCTLVAKTTLRALFGQVSRPVMEALLSARLHGYFTELTVLGPRFRLWWSDPRMVRRKAAKKLHPRVKRTTPILFAEKQIWPTTPYDVHHCSFTNNVVVCLEVPSDPWTLRSRYRTCLLSTVQTAKKLDSVVRQQY